MARLFTTGFENGTEWTTTVGTPTITTALANTGTHSLRCNPTAATWQINQAIYAADDNTAHVFLRAYLYIATAPAAVTGIMAWSDNASATPSGFYGVKLLPDRTLIITNSTGTTGGTATTPIPLNTWTRIEFDYNDSAGTGSIYIDGALATSRTGISLDGGRYARFGVLNATTADLYFDDVAVNDATGASNNGLPGPVGAPQQVTLGAARETASAGTVSRRAPNFSTISDSFNDGTVNETLWPSSYNPGRFTETGGRARVVCGLDYNAFATAPAYTLTGSVVAVQVFPAAAGAAVAEAWTQVLIMSGTAGTDLVMEVDAVAGEINMAARVDYWDDTAVRIPYNPTDHAWFRIREDAGTLHWETAPDGETWTSRRTAATPAWGAALNLALQLIAHRDAGDEDYAEFDNLNYLPTGQEAFLRPAAEAGAVRPLVGWKATTLAAARAGARAGVVAAAKTAGLGRPRVADASRPVTAGRVVLLGPAAEPAAARSLVGVKSTPVGAARERDAARLLVQAPTLRLGPAREQTAARPIGRELATTLRPATETTDAQPLASTKTTINRPARTGDAAAGLRRAKRHTLGAARDGSRAGTLTAAGETRLRTARDTAGARPLTAAKAALLAPGRTVAAGGPLVGSKSGRLGHAPGTGTARPLTTAKTTTLTSAREQADARPVAAAKQLVLGAARETTVVQRLRVQLAGGLGTARGQDAARRVAAAKQLLLGPARATDRGRLLSAMRIVRIGPVRAADRGSALATGKTVRIGAARCGERASSPVLSARARIGSARAVDWAGRVAQPFQTRRWHTVRATDRAGTWTWTKQRPADQLTPSVSGPVLTPSASGPVLAASVTGPSLTASTSGGG